MAAFAKSHPSSSSFAGYTLGRGFDTLGRIGRFCDWRGGFDFVATSADRVPAIAVAIPCHNEAAAIALVVADWRQALPEAEIVVFDNNSTDGTGAIARRLGVRVVEVRDQGKGHAVRAIFEDLADREAVIMIDGDGTYPASAAHAMLGPVMAGMAEMTVGARRPVASAKAMSPIRGLGNLLISSAFRVLIGAGTKDLLSGYRVFSRRFREVVRPRSSGFEIEAELSGQAVTRNLRVVEIPVPYHPRIAGTVSKLRAFRDGRRILLAIVAQSFRFRPWRPLLSLAAPLALIGLMIGSWPLVLAAATLVVAAVGALAWLTTRRR